jgi:hypothetical protein
MIPLLVCSALLLERLADEVATSSARGLTFGDFYVIM